MESRRSIASTFKYSEIYFFVCRCMTAFNSPGTEQAQKALNAIADSGSFRLVSDSRRDFLAMFPAADQPADDDQPNPSDPPAQAKTIATVQPEGSREDAVESGSGQVPRKEPQREPYHARACNPPAARRAAQPGDKPERATQRPDSARPWSGGPFRP